MNAVQKSEMAKSLIGLAQETLSKFLQGATASVSLLDLVDLPESSGVYAATDDVGHILYVGKANNLRERCNLCSHHKLAKATRKGAKRLCFVLLPKEDAWQVEQYIISEIKPVMNEHVSLWWQNEMPVAFSEEPCKPDVDLTCVTGRIKKNFYMDERAIELISSIAKGRGTSQNKALENIILFVLKERGQLPLDFEELPEGRGGDRTTTKPSAHPTADDTERKP